MIESFLVNMTSFNKKRNIRVYSPKGYIHEQKAYPVLYMRDGQNVFHDEEVNGGSLSMERYLDENSIEVIVVAIDQNSEERIKEYCTFLLKEKLPALTVQVIDNGEHNYTNFKKRVPEIFSFLNI